MNNKILELWVALDEVPNEKYDGVISFLFEVVVKNQITMSLRLDIDTTRGDRTTKKVEEDALVKESVTQDVAIDILINFLKEINTKYSKIPTIHGFLVHRPMAVMNTLLNRNPLTEGISKYNYYNQVSYNVKHLATCLQITNDIFNQYEILTKQSHYKIMYGLEKHIKDEGWLEKKLKDIRHVNDKLKKHIKESNNG